MTDFQHLKSEIQNWNLYTDEKLLSKLDSFINNMMAQCEIITKNTQQTLYEAQAVSIYLSDTFNSLSNLSNKQFVENSVASVEQPQIVQPKQLDQNKQVTAEKKQENFQQALKNVIGAFSIADKDDDETLSKSNTMPAMFRTVDHLPYITGSKAFNEDEFLGIIDRNESLHNDALGNDSNQSAVMIEQQSNNDYSEQNRSDMAKAKEVMRVALPVTLFPPGISNRVPINNMLLGSPPPLQQLFKQYEQEAAAKPYRNIVKIVQEEQKIETSDAQPQRTFQQELNEKLGGEILSQSNRQAQFNEIQEIRPSARNVLDILSDPMYQRVQPRPQIRQNQLFNEDSEDEDEEIGNKNMFRDSNAKRNNFRNLLNPAVSIGNPLLKSFNNANPFDPFGLQNPFMPFNPKPTQDQAPAEREETKEQLETDSPANVSMPQGHGRKLLKFLNEDSDEDEETRLQNRLLEWQKPGFTQGLRFMNKASEVEEKSATKGRVSKLFRDEEGIPRLQSNEPEKPETKTTDYEGNNFIQNPASRPKKDGTTRPNRPSLFFDNDDDVRVAKPEPKTQRRTRLFSDSE